MNGILGVIYARPLGVSHSDYRLVIGDELGRLQRTRSVPAAPKPMASEEREEEFIPTTLMLMT